MEKITLIKRGGTRYGPAPHKAILLLSIIDIIENQRLKENKIRIDQNLIESFKRNWKLLVSPDRSYDIGKPIYHLQNDGFWNTITKEGKKLEQVISSERQLIAKLSHGSFQKELFGLLQDNHNLALFRMVLIDTFFSLKKKKYIKKLPALFNEIDLEILEEATPIYRKHITTNEGFVRSWKFRNYVLNAYNKTCSISDLKVEPNYALIEAAHIKQHAKFGIDSITNGIALSVHLHRAFDNGLIGISEDYKVLVQNNKIFKENISSPFNIRQFEGKQIALPETLKYYPSQENLSWHRERFGFI